MNVSKQFNFLWIAFFSLFHNTYAAGDLTRQDPIEIKIDMKMTTIRVILDMKISYLDSLTDSIKTHPVKEIAVFYVLELLHNV